MPSISRNKIAISIPSNTLQQMCNFVAIAETKSQTDCLRALLLHTLYRFEDEQPSDIKDISYILKTMFGLDVPNHQLQETIDYLITTGEVSQPFGTNYVLSSEARLNIKRRIDQSAELQERVKMQWLAEIITKIPEVKAEIVWQALQAYVSKAFLRHGIQVTIFLDPSVELPTEYADSLSAILNDIVKSQIDPPYQKAVRNVISDFFANAGNNPDRAQFITECADGAANYFSLAITPDVASEFRKKLNPLILFCDTNFLFGILDLHVHPMVEVSSHLLKAITRHNLPLRARYHINTFTELQTSIGYYSELLNISRWSRAMSRAATTSRLMSGIELKYHQKNAESGMDVEEFLRPYKHVDILLKQHNIEIYQPTNDRFGERAKLEGEYQDYLKKIKKEKPYNLISHDVAVLDCVHSLRNDAKSTLEMGALFVTCDYILYKFDNEKSQKEKSLASVVLPNVLWQILRPFIPANQDFNRSFVETFAIPEFRTIGSGASKACSKMLSLLNAYKDFPEETAARLLSNDILINTLRTVENEQQFQEQVESAIASENQILYEERAYLARQLGNLRSDKEAIEKELLEQKQLTEIEFARAREATQKKEREIEEITSLQKITAAKIDEITSELSDVKNAKIEAEKVASDEIQKRNEIENKTLRREKVTSIIIAILISLFSMHTIHNIYPWNWLLNHPNSYGLQGCIFLMLSFGIIGLWVKPWRKALWVTGISGLIFVVLQLIGGPNKIP